MGNANSKGEKHPPVHSQARENSRFRPTVKGLDHQLKDLIHWERLAIHLPQISPVDIEAVKQNNPSDVNAQKLALFDKWLQVDPKASWNSVVLALEVIDENNIAQKIQEIQQEQEQLVTPPAVQMKQMLEQDGKTELAQIVSNALSHEMKIQEDTVLELSKLHDKFISLSFECEKAIEELVESGKLSLSDLVKHTKKEIVDNEQSHVENLKSCLEIISSHNHFLNCHLLVVLAEEFLNPSKLLDKLQTHEEDIEQFLSNTKIQTLHKTLTPFVTKSPQEDPITLSVENSYGEYKIRLVEHLLRVLFRLERKDIPKFFRVIPG